MKPSALPGGPASAANRPALLTCFRFCSLTGSDLQRRQNGPDLVIHPVQFAAAAAHSTYLYLMLDGHVFPSECIIGVGSGF